jgi:hypothetical protein
MCALFCAPCVICIGNGTVHEFDPGQIEPIAGYQMILAASAIAQPHIRSTYVFRGFTDRATELLKEIRSGAYSRRQWFSPVA